MLHRFEWEFDEKHLPNDQVEECWTYEFSRECPELVKLIDEWRLATAIEQPDFQSFKRHAAGRKTGLIRIKNDIRLIPIGVYFMFPEWPATPFRKIPPGVRLNRFKALLENESPMGLPQTKRAKAAKNAWKERDGSIPDLRESSPIPASLE